MDRSFRASKTGLEKAKQAFKLTGWTQEYLAGRVGCTRQTVNKFFARRAIDKGRFQNICNEIGCEWGDIADLNSDEKEFYEHLTMNKSAPTTETNACKSNQVPSDNTEKFTVPDEVASPKATDRAMFVISGSINDINEARAQLKAMVAHLQTISGDVSLTITRVDEIIVDRFNADFGLLHIFWNIFIGNNKNSSSHTSSPNNRYIKITLESSFKGFEKLVALFKLGKLKEILDISVEKVQLLETS